MSMPVGSLKDLVDLLEGRGQYVFEDRPFRFYGVLLYAPTNGLNQFLHQYVVGHFQLFNRQTGPNWLVAVLEDINRKQGIDEFRPEDVYAIARYLGVRVDAVPAIVLFTEPKERNDTLVLSLKSVLPEAGELGDEHFTTLIGKLAAIIDEISERDLPAAARLEALRSQIAKEWPKDPDLGKRLAAGLDWLDASTTKGASIMRSLSTIVEKAMAFSNYFPQ